MADPTNPDDLPENDHKAKMDELFGDLDEELAALPTPDALMEQNAALLKQLLEAQQENTDLLKEVEEARKNTRRAEAKTEEDKKFAVEKFVKEMLPVVDNLERALSSTPQKQREDDPKFAKLADGIEKTLGQLKAVFNKFGVHEINPLGHAFDENKHDVITTRPQDGVEPETVIQVAQKGYEIEGHVIRPAKVIVTPQ